MNPPVLNPPCQAHSSPPERANRTPSHRTPVSVLLAINNPIQRRTTRDTLPTSFGPTYTVTETEPGQNRPFEKILTGGKRRPATRNNSGNTHPADPNEQRAPQFMVEKTPMYDGKPDAVAVHHAITDIINLLNPAT